MAPLFQALEDLQSSIGDTVVFPEPRLFPLHAMCSCCWKVVNGAHRFRLTGRPAGRIRTCIL